MIPSDPNAITVIAVPNTPSGVEMLERFRRDQLRNTAIAWATPAAAFLAAALFSAFGWALGISLASLAFLLSGAAAPGLTAVFFLRRRKARKIAESLPQLAAARVLLKGKGPDGAR